MSNTNNLLSQLRRLSTGADDSRIRSLAKALEASGVDDISDLRHDQLLDVRMHLLTGQSWQAAYENSDANGESAYEAAFELLSGRKGGPPEAA